ncbi:hypothetical protein BKA56DRAFT_306069 [Ilyonectria sp. MPI-CAGE-AT-0026]|nr:hypothetical protein BKA56DRAFT_306069 [Ilyonectria sp. MPI-CAGE-AT-0026]
MLRITAHLNLLRQIPPVRCPLSRSSRRRIPPVFPSAQTFFLLFVSGPPVSLRLEVRSRGPSALWGVVILAATFRVAQHKRHDPGFLGPARSRGGEIGTCLRSVAAAQSTSPSVPTLCTGQREPESGPSRPRLGRSNHESRSLLPIVIPDPRRKAKHQKEEPIEMLRCLGLGLKEGPPRHGSLGSVASFRLFGDAKATAGRRPTWKHGLSTIIGIK